MSVRNIIISLAIETLTVLDDQHPFGKRSAQIQIVADNNATYHLCDRDLPDTSAWNEFCMMRRPALWHSGRESFLSKEVDDWHWPVWSFTNQTDAAGNPPCFYLDAITPQNRPYVVVLAKLRDWCDEPIAECEREQPFQYQDHDDVVITVNGKVSDRRTCPSQPEPEVIPEETVAQKIQRAQTAFQKRLTMTRRQSALLRKSETLVDDKNTLPSALVRDAIEFAGDYCSREDVNELIVLEEQYHALMQQIAQKVQCLIPE